MKYKNLFLALALIVGFATTSFAQAKIGHANIELILAYMPETQTMNNQLQTYQKKLGETLQVKEKDAQAKYMTFLEKQKAGASEAELKPLQEELVQLDQSMRKEAKEAEQKVLKKRQELLQPIIDKLQKGIDDVAKEKGYDYVLNSIDGSGVSIVLHGPEEHDLTKVIMTKLGIDVSKLGQNK